VRDGVVYRQPTSLAERADLAQKCLKDMKLTMPCVLDDMENTTERAYHAWPDRICIVDVDGKVAYYGAQGPGGFRPREAEEALKKILAAGGRFVPGETPEGK
jgi:hypothetical protein